MFKPAKAAINFKITKLPNLFKLTEVPIHTSNVYSGIDQGSMDHKSLKIYAEIVCAISNMSIELFTNTGFVNK
jgi:hypothetical protein